jgi:anti-anti-sigma factor
MDRDDRPERLVQTVDRSDGVRIVTVQGAVDVFSAGRLARDAIAGLPTGASEIVLDLEAVSSLDSAGVSALVKLVRSLRAQSIATHASLGGHSVLSASMVNLLRQVVEFDDEPVVVLPNDEPVIVIPSDETPATGSAR